MYTIIGKGFGLYGYLPAIIMNNSNLVLSNEYKFNIQKRKDINQYINKIKWTQNIEEAIAREKVLKKWKRKWKFNLIKKSNPEFNSLTNKFLKIGYRFLPAQE